MLDNLRLWNLYRLFDLLLNIILFFLKFFLSSFLTSFNIKRTFFLPTIWWSYLNFLIQVSSILNINLYRIVKFFLKAFQSFPLEKVLLGRQQLPIFDFRIFIWSEIKNLTPSVVFVISQLKLCGFKMLVYHGIFKIVRSNIHIRRLF